MASSGKECRPLVRQPPRFAVRSQGPGAGHHRDEPGDPHARLTVARLHLLTPHTVALDHLGRQPWSLGITQIELGHGDPLRAPQEPFDQLAGPGPKRSFGVRRQLVAHPHRAEVVDVIAGEDRVGPAA